MPSEFRKQLKDLQGTPEKRKRTVYVPYDQLTDAVGPLAETDPAELAIVMIETPWKGNRRPYHQQKLAAILANSRNFALEQARRGVVVHYRMGTGSFGEVLRECIHDIGPLEVMEPAERELRVDLQPLVDEGQLQMLPHEGWLTTREQFRASNKKAPWRMDKFYRKVRRETGYLMEGGKPAGGKYSHDADNRKKWTGDPPAPEPPTFEPNAITREVGDLIAEHFSHHPGHLDLAALAATREDAETLWRWAREECMAAFGPYEDAMSTASRTLFHTRLSTLLNLHRLLPQQVVEDVLALDIPLNSKEGFLRQVIGWREFMYHVHRETDGFRTLPEGISGLPTTPEVRSTPGDGGWSGWHDEAWETPSGGAEELDGGAAPTALDAKEAVPPAYWGTPSGLHCLDTVVASVWEEGYSHHITRLMVLGNLATLLDISPRELADWFWVAYTDAYDWVVEPNVLGMGTYGLGELFVTKPYVSGAAYIHRMSDYCSECAFDPKKTCPITRLYWAFLARHGEHFSGNHRMGLVMKNLEKRSEDDKALDQETFEVVRTTLAKGERLTPDLLASQTALDL